jgi:hypothetical protein
VIGPFAADPSGALDLSVFAQYGILGILALMLIIFARGAHQRERDRADRAETDNRALRDMIRERERAENAEAESRRLHELMIDRVIPALSSATRVAEETAELLASIQREREIAAAFSRRRELEGGPP